MRDSTITKNRISYYSYENHRNHKTIYKRKYCGSHICRVFAVKLIRAAVWKLIGWAL